MLGELLTQAREDALRARRRKDHPRVCRCSDPPFPGTCLREKTYAITHWSERPTHDLQTEARFWAGEVYHREVLREVLGFGLQVSHVETDMVFERAGIGEILTGHPDFYVRRDGELWVVEVKSVTPFVFPKLETVEDFERHEWFNRYPWQLQLYLEGAARQFPEATVRGVFLLSNLTGEWRTIEVERDPRMAEVVLNRAEIVKACLQEQILPEFSTDPTLCTKCWARAAGVCAPPVVPPAEGGLQILEDVELPAKIERFLELQPLAKEFDAVKKELAATVHANKIQRAIAGDFEIAVSWRDRTAYEVPEDVRDQYKVVHPKATAYPKYRRVEGERAPTTEGEEVSS